jgi:hypothetical protein
MLVWQNVDDTHPFDSVSDMLPDKDSNDWQNENLPLTTHGTQANTTASHRSLLSNSIPAYINWCIRKRPTPKMAAHTNTHAHHVHNTCT